MFNIQYIATDGYTYTFYSPACVQGCPHPLAVTEGRPLVDDDLEYFATAEEAARWAWDQADQNESWPTGTINALTAALKALVL